MSERPGMTLLHLLLCAALIGAALLSPSTARAIPPECSETYNPTKAYCTEVDATAWAYYARPTYGNGLELGPYPSLDAMVAGAVAWQNWRSTLPPSDTCRVELITTTAGAYIYDLRIPVGRSGSIQMTWFSSAPSDPIPCQRTSSGTGSTWRQERIAFCPRPMPGEANGGSIYDAAEDKVYCARSWTAVRKTHECQTLSRGNPCSITTGEKVESATDYRGSGAFPLEFVRSYRTQLAYNQSAHQFAPVGIGWRASYFQRIDYRANYGTPLAYVERQGGRRMFRQSGSAFIGDADANERLVRLLDGSGNPIGWKYTTAAEVTELYDVDGRLTSLTDRAGNTQTLAYAVATDVVPQSVTDANGNALQFEYYAADDFGQTGALFARLKKLTLPGGSSIDYTFGTWNRLTSVTYADGASVTYHNEGTGSDAIFLLTGITDEAGVRYSTFTYSGPYAQSTEHAGGVAKYTFQYWPNGGRVVTDPLNTARTYTTSIVQGSRVPATSNLVTPGKSEAKSWTYDGNGNASSVTDFNNNVTTHAYDLTRNLETSRTEAYGTAKARTTTTQWHSTFRLPTQIDEPGRRTTFTHDSNGNVLTKTVLDTSTSESRTWTYTYNGFGQGLTADGPRTDVSDVTTYTYYSCTTGYQCGQVQTITNALNHVTTYNTYNAHGQPLTITDPNGLVTTLTYDARQRLTSRTVGTEQTIFDYWPTGLLKKATLPDSSFLEYTYDAAHRLTEIEDSEGNRVVYTLDAMGNRTAENLYDPSSALTQTRTRVFNTLNQLWKELGAAGTAAVTTTFAYDSNGNQTGINAPLSRNSIQAYDELNRMTQVTDPLSGVTQYGYNALDQLISVTDPRSKVTSYTYNALGDLTQQVSPDTGTTTNTYDSGGNLATSTDARTKTATYGYDALNRVTSLTYPDQTISYTYDSGTNQKGRLTQVSDASGSTSWSYDTHGRVLSRQQSMGVTKTLGYAYDSFGRLQTLTLPSGNTIGYGYTDGKITSLTLNGSTTILSNVLYQPFGPTSGWTWGNSTLAVREYDTDGKVTDIDSAGLKTYSYDDAFRITGITDAADSSLSQSYAYDLLDRLTSATGTSLNQGWTYDANGNRLSQTGSAASTYTVSGTSNRLSGVSGALSRTYGYDNAGNTTSDGAATFTYNDAGRMVSATKASVTTTYALNALGQRVKKTTSGSSRYFVYDEAGHLVGEYDNAGSLVQETVWLGDTPVATLRPNGGGVNHFYVHTDHLNSPRRISRPSDNVVVWRWDSDPFGHTSANEDPDGDSNAFAFGLRFPGQYLDAETGLHYNYFRDYDPAVGRYAQSDPIGLEGGLNTYAYVESNPLSFADPTGENAVAAGIRVFGLGQRIGGMVNAGVEAATGLPIGVHIYDLTHQDEESDWDATQLRIDHKNYHRACDRPPPPGLDPCEEARWRYRQAMKCQRLRQDWEDRWGTSETAKSHAEALRQVKQRLKNAAEDIARFCAPSCP